MNLFDLKKGWEWTNLEGVASSEKNAIVDGPFGSSMKTSDYVESGVPVLQGKNVTNNQFRWFDVRFISDVKAIELQRSKVRVGDILMVKIGSIGYSAIVDDLQGYPFAIIPANLAKVTINTSRIDRKYLQYWLTSPSIKEYLVNSASKTAQPALSLSKIKNTPVPLPPLPEQKRIAAILDKADSIWRKRQEAVRLTEDLLRSVFLDMFGDPVTNPKGWPVVEFGELCEELRYGTSSMCSSARQDGDLPVLRIPNVIGGLINWDDLKHVQLPEAEINRLRLEQGDLLFVRTNGNPEYIGRCAVFDDTRAALYASYLIRARLRKDAPCLPQYASSCFTFPTYRKRLVAEAKTTAGNFNINTEGLKSLKLPIPPLSTQQQFLALRKRLSTSIVRLQSGIRESDTLFNSLLQNAFK